MSESPPVDGTIEGFDFSVVDPQGAHDISANKILPPSGIACTRGEFNLRNQNLDALRLMVDQITVPEPRWPRSPPRVVNFALIGIYTPMRSCS